MKILLFSISLFLILGGCKSTVNDAKYFYILFTKWDDYKGDTIYFSQSVAVNNGIYDLQYWNKDSTYKDTIRYELSLNKSFTPSLKNSHEKYDIFVDKDTTVLIDQDSIKIMKFGVNYGITDGATDHYWTPDYGIFLMHSTTWPTLRILCSTDSIQNQKLMKLIKIICPRQKFLFRGRLLEIMNKTKIDDNNKH